MNVQLPLRMDQATFLDWVQGQEERYELDQEKVVMMTGGSRAHWQIAFNLAKALDSRLDPNTWSVLPEFGVNLKPGSVRYPDVTVDIAGATGTDLIATAPVLICEVLSPASEQLDLEDKPALYLHLPSLTAYLVFSQDQMKVWAWLRRTDGFPAEPIELDQADATIEIEALGIEVPLAEVYSHVRFS